MSNLDGSRWRMFQGAFSDWVNGVEDNPPLRGIEATYIDYVESGDEVGEEELEDLAALSCQVPSVQVSFDDLVGEEDSEDENATLQVACDKQCLSQEKLTLSVEGEDTLPCAEVVTKNPLIELMDNKPISEKIKRICLEQSRAAVTNALVMGPVLLQVARVIERLTNGRLCIPGSVCTEIEYRDSLWNMLNDPRIRMWYDDKEISLYVPQIHPSIGNTLDYRSRTHTSCGWRVQGRTRVVYIDSTPMVVYCREDIIWEKLEDTNYVGYVCDSRIKQDTNVMHYPLPQVYEESRRFLNTVEKVNVEPITYMDAVCFRHHVSKDLVTFQRPPTMDYGPVDVLRVLVHCVDDSSLHSRRFYRNLTAYGGIPRSRCVMNMLAIMGFICRHGQWTYSGFVKLLSSYCPGVLRNDMPCRCDDMLASVIRQPVRLKGFRRRQNLYDKGGLFVGLVKK